MQIKIEKNQEGQEPSPFKIYEENYCNKCEDYRGCLGLIDSITMDTQNSKKSGSDAIDNMIRNMGSMTFTSRFKLILDCMKMRNYLEETIMSSQI